jgi:hypothetical protein
MTQVPETNPPPSGSQDEQQLEVVTKAFLFYRVWVGVGFLAMFIISIGGKNTPDGIGLALVTTAVFLLTPEIGEALSGRGLWSWLESRRWQRGMVTLGAAGALITTLGILVFGSRIVGLLGVAVIEAAAFELIPVWVGKTFEPLVEVTQEDTEIRENWSGLRSGGALRYSEPSCLSLAALSSSWRLSAEGPNHMASKNATHISTARPSAIHAAETIMNVSVRRARHWRV